MTQKTSAHRWLDLVAGTHTRLINMFMGLCADTRHWPNVLAKMGYKVQLIEQSVSLQSAKKAVPDVVSVSNNSGDHRRFRL